MDRRMLGALVVAVLIGVSLSVIQRMSEVQSDGETDAGIDPTVREARTEAARPQPAAAIEPPATGRSSPGGESGSRDTGDGWSIRPEQPAPIAVGSTEPESMAPSGRAAGDAPGLADPATDSTDSDHSSDTKDEPPTVPPEWAVKVLIVHVGTGSIIFADPNGPFSEFSRPPPYGQPRSQFFELRDLLIAPLWEPPLNEAPPSSQRYRILMVGDQCQLLWLGLSTGRLTVDERIWAMDARAEASFIDAVEARAQYSTSGEHWLDWWSGQVTEDPSDCRHYGPNTRGR